MRNIWWAIAFVAVGGSAQAQSSGLPALKEELAGEVAAREGADAVLDARVAGEEARATVAEQDLRAAGDRLQGQLDAAGAALADEQRNRAAADGEVQGVLAAEQRARAARDAELQGGLAGEQAARAASDDQLRADVVAEAAARAAALAAATAQHAGALSAISSGIQGAASRESGERQAADDAMVAAMQAEIVTATEALRGLAGELKELLETLAGIDVPPPPQRPGEVETACGSSELEALAVAMHGRLAGALTPAARTAIARETSLLRRTPVNATALSGVRSRVEAASSGGSSPTGIQETLFVVLRQSIYQANDDKAYWLEKLAQYDAIGEALGDYMQELVEASQGLSPGVEDGAPLPADVQTAASSALVTLKAALAAACCGDGRDPLGCASILDPASCGAPEQVQTDPRLGVPTAVRQLRTAASFAQAKGTAAETSAELFTRKVAQSAGQVGALCQELSAVLTPAP